MILIYGKGKVGNALVELCRYKEIPFAICDENDAPASFDTFEYIIPSPGIPENHRIYGTGKVLAELDFAYSFLPEAFKILAVTGTDGKSTTSWILYNILKDEFSVKKPVYISGNFDIPFSETILEILRNRQKSGYIVVEVSSFMSYAIGKNPNFKPFVAEYSIFTNFRRDHLNWHGSLQDYLDSKMNLLYHTKKVAVLSEQVIEFSVENNLTLLLPTSPRIFHASRERKKQRDWTNGDDIVISGRKKYHLNETSLTGMHNAQNILAATLVTNEMKICSKRTKTYLKNISGLPHRLQKIGEKNGIIFVEDSKSTSAQSLEAALSSYGSEKNLLLIVGGSDKGDTFEHLSSLFSGRVKSLAAIGATKEHFIEIAERQDIPYMATDNLFEAVQFLWNQGVQGDVLMLSPGCASFGLFKDYLDRAEQFREALKKLS